MVRRVHWLFLLSMAAASAACGDDGGTPDATPIDAAPQTGTISLSWSLTDGDSAVTCADVGAVTVRLTATPSGGSIAAVDALSCAGLAGTSRGLPIGTYDVVVGLYATAGSLATPVMAGSVEVTEGADKAIGEVEFTVIPTGGLSFNITNATGDANCATSGAPNAGLGEMLIELRDTSTSECIPATLEVAAGASTSARTITVDCTTPVPCIEADQDITATGVPSGNRTLELTADLGGLGCFTRSSQFTIPGNNLSFLLGSQSLSRDESVPGCELSDGGSVTDAGVADAGVADAL